MNDPFAARRPAVRFVVVFIGGILVGNQVSLPSAWGNVAVLVLLGIASLIMLRRDHTAATNPVLWLLVFVIGFSLQRAQREEAVGKTLRPGQEEECTVSGWIDGEPTRQEKKVTFVVRTDVIRHSGVVDLRRKRVLSTLWIDNNFRPPPLLECGTRIAAKGMLQPFPFPRNPGEFDYGRYLTLNDIQGTVTIAGSEDLIVTHESSLANFNALVGAIQRRLYALIDRFHSPEQAGFLKGVILGYRADLSTEIKQSFMNTGTVHILAVSGSNVAVVVLIIYSMFGFLRLPKRLTGFGTILGIALFTFVTGASPSVVRAGIMASVILIGTMVERKPDIYNTLSVSAIIILFLDSNALFDVGFQLSFAAVLSIVYFYPILVKLISLIPERFEEIKGIDYLLKLFAVSLAAQIGTLPFTAYYFGRVSIISLLANLIVVPLSGFNVLAGIATVAFGTVSTHVASCYAALNSVAMWFLLGFVKVAGNVPFAYVETARFEPIHAVLYYSLIATLFHVNRRAVVARGAAVSLLVIDVMIYGGIFQHRPGVLTVTVIDVGQGDAILVEMPNRKRLLIDAGQRQLRYDAGERFILPVLKRKGIGSLDGILITHRHSDHIGGIPYLIGNLPVEGILASDAFPLSTSHGGSEPQTSDHPITPRTVQRGAELGFAPNVRMYVLHPGTNAESRGNLNNMSVVVKLLYGSTSMLLVGDADLEAEGQMSARYGRFLASDILKIGHHGSKTSSGDRFVKCVHPAVALISVGVRNKFGHPSSAALERLASAGSEIRRTDAEGALVYETDGSNWWCRDWKTKNLERVQSGSN